MLPLVLIRGVLDLVEIVGGLWFVTVNVEVNWCILERVNEQLDSVGVLFLPQLVRGVRSDRVQLYHELGEVFHLRLVSLLANLLFVAIIHQLSLADEEGKARSTCLLVQWLHTLQVCVQVLYAFWVCILDFFGCSLEEVRVCKLEEFFELNFAGSSLLETALKFLARTTIREVETVLYH